MKTLALLGLLTVPVVLLAQPPAAQEGPVQLDPANNRLDYVLVNWEKSMKDVQSLVAQCERTQLDKVFQKKEHFEGAAKYYKTGTDNLASLEMRPKGANDFSEKYLCTGTYLYQYVPAQKQIRVHDLPKPASGKVADDNFLSFLFGMKAAEAKQRYHLTYLEPPAGDQWYFYIDVRPKTAADKVDFTKARLVLLRSSFMPRQLWFEEPNGNEITWDFPRIQTGVPLDPRDFAPPQQLPEGWQLVRPGQAQPTTIRPQQ